MVRKAAEKSPEIDVVQLRQGEVTVCVLGRSPLIYNAMSEKAKCELLMPKGRMTSAEKRTNLKHDPIEEFQNSVYRVMGDNSPTRLVFPSAGFKRALMDAALDMPTNASKAQMGRLTYVVGSDVSIWGVPELLMSVVRSADMNKTPDVRTRAILPQWASKVTIRYVEPMLNATTVTTLLAAAGFVLGIGDFRQQKGAGNYGTFELVSEDNEEYQAVLSAGHLAAQDAALADPVPHDAASDNLLQWYNTERERRGTAAPANDSPKRRRRAAVAAE